MIATQRLAALRHSWLNSMMLVFPVVLALGLAATAADTISFRFAWPQGLAADVQYDTSRTRTGRPPSAQTARGRLVTEVRGGELRVGFREWRSAGTGSATVKVDPSMQAALMQAGNRITTVATRAGAFVRVEGIEPAIDVIRTLWKDAPAEARPMLARLEQLAPAMFTKEATELWSALVQFWQGRDLDVGEDYQVDSSVPVPALPGEAVRILARLRVERRFACPDGRGSCVEVKMRSEANAKDVERVTKRFISELKVPGQVDAMLGEMSAVTEIVLVTEPARLVPHRLEKIRTIRVSPSPAAATNAESRDGRDEAVWTFTYPTGPARAAGAP